MSAMRATLKMTDSPRSRTACALTLAVGVALSLSVTSHAGASCVLPDPAIVWSYPAEGATDVPVDARIFLRLNTYSERHPVGAARATSCAQAAASVGGPGPRSPPSPRSPRAVVATDPARHWESCAGPPPPLAV